MIPENLSKALFFSSLLDDKLIELLREGKIGVLRTDTIYGIVARADLEQSVERVFALKGRDDSKSPIVLIANTAQVFDPQKPAERKLARDVWPGKVTIAHPATHAPKWLTRGNTEFGYRMPNVNDLRALIRKTGPLIAPSANPQAEPPATTIEQAIEYFGDQVDFYVDGGRVTDNTPSQLVRINERGEIERLR